MERRLGWVCLLVIGMGCTGPSPVQIAGAWTGTMSAVVNGWNGEFSLSLSQSDDQITGAWAASNNPDVGGAISGKADGDNVTLDLGQAISTNCAYSVAATVTGPTKMSGSYTVKNCPAFPNLQGQFAATK